MSPPLAFPALTAVEVSDGDLFALLTEIYGTKFTGMLILHCIDGVPKRAEFPARQVRLSASLPARFDKSPTLG